MRAEIVSIGTEIMFGEITDTNASYIAGQLPQYGIDLLWVTQVGDNPARLTEALKRALDRSDYIFTTGGLGPTEDDITREMVGAAMGEELFVDPEQEALLRANFARRGIDPMPPRNIKQAMRIPSARVLENPRGTAPGWWVERDGKVITVMPGPPAETHHMWETLVAPELERRADAILVSRTLKTVGLGEAALDEALTSVLSGTNPSIGTYARADGVALRLAAKAKTREEAQALIAPVEAEIRRLIPGTIWGVDDDSMAAGVGRMLREQGLTLGLMESASGGAIASAITDVAGSSDYFRGGIVSYATEVKTMYGVPAETIATHGLYSRETAEAMAKAARVALKSDLGLGLTGIAGNEPLEGQPAGTMHLALADADTVEYMTFRFLQGREQTKRRAVQQALILLRKYLMERAAK